MRRSLICLAALATLFATASWGGVAPVDNFQWLEDAHAPAAVAWAKARTDKAVAELKADPQFPLVERDLMARLRASAPFPTVYLLGQRFVRLIRDERHPDGLLQVAAKQDGAPLAWRTVLDVAALNRREGSSYVLSGLSLFDFADRCLPPRFDRCMLGLSPKGSSNLALREFDLGKGAFVHGGFQTPPNRMVMAWLGPDTLLIGHSLSGSAALPSNFPATIRLWRRGTPLSAAKPIYTAAPDTSIVEVNAFGAGANRRGVLKVIHDYSTVSYELIARDGELNPIALPEKVKSVGQAALVFPYVAVQLAKTATLDGKTYPAESVVAYDVRPNASHRYSAVFTPREGVYVNDGVQASGSGVVFVEDRNLRKSVVVARPGPSGGWSAYTAVEAPRGDGLSVVEPDGVGSQFLVQKEGFLTPPMMTVVAPGRKPVTVASGRPILDARQYVVDIRAARAKDGTAIDYYLVRPKNLPAGPTPTIMTGYGCFGINADPGYFSGGLNRGLASWLEHGGAFVTAAIRGGGERGEAWHLAGAGLHKQVAFDDFIAVAENLTHRGFTTPQELGIYGRSCGGLLTAAMVAQRPDLFGAAFVGVPVTDLDPRTTTQSGIIKGQKAEFGDWDDPKALPIILDYSPYENLRPGVRYPRVLVLTSTEDNQVGPGQARRFAARLEALGADPLFIEDPEGGHGAPDPLRRPDLLAAETVFFMQALMH
ncbi:MAG TPA: prolyl oligopeptidase family serine peptidase [Caulobacteraceae bacterium]|jgi:prolyl oligopeptidase|nr:prolyl oligopeptidase family serine peptidase [Caulobacteraceae bacterium]